MVKTPEKYRRNGFARRCAMELANRNKDKILIGSMNNLSAHAMDGIVLELNPKIKEAKATDLHIAKTYYHGTDSKEAYENILMNGIVPPDLSDRKGFLKPVEGRVYLAQDIAYALIYAIGGDMAGSKLCDSDIEKSRYGYIFEVQGTELQDIQPDEDEVGRLIYYSSCKEDEDKKQCPLWLKNKAEYLLGKTTLNRVYNGYYIWWARAGKTVLKAMTDNQKLELIDRGVHIANHGTVKPSGVWIVDKKDCELLKRDGSNIKEIATYKKITNKENDMNEQMYETTFARIAKIVESVNVTCEECGDTFEAGKNNARYCPKCARDRRIEQNNQAYLRHKNDESRRIGTEEVCECGKTYTVTSGRNKQCPECQAAERTQYMRDHSKRIYHEND